MKKIISILLVITLISQMFVNVGIGLYYELNKTYIAQQLCENRNNPQMHCNGHCYLSKQLKKNEEKQNKSSQFLREQTEILSNQTQQISLQYFPHLEVIKIHSADFSLYVSAYTNSLLKPPAA